MVKKQTKLIEIDNIKFKEAIEIYQLWKNLDAKIKTFYSRGVNIHEAITEIIVCFVNGFPLSLGGGSEDAINPKNNFKVQIKATSNFNRDLTSFGPKSKFDELHFVRLDYEKDIMFLYNIPINLLGLNVNKNKTFDEVKKEGKRPRFSIIKDIIIKNNIKEYAKVKLNTAEIIKF
jgi:hypothetical protein